MTRLAGPRKSACASGTLKRTYCTAETRPGSSRSGSTSPFTRAPPTSSQTRSRRPKSVASRALTSASAPVSSIIRVADSSPGPGSMVLKPSSSSATSSGPVIRSMRKISCTWNFTVVRFSKTNVMEGPTCTRRSFRSEALELLGHFLRPGDPLDAQNLLHLELHRGPVLEDERHGGPDLHPPVLLRRDHFLAELIAHAFVDGQWPEVLRRQRLHQVSSSGDTI